MRKLLLTAMILLSIGCSIDTSIALQDTEEREILQQFQALDSLHKVKITKENEPGEKLRLCITLADKKNKRKLNNQRIHFFHTSAEGEYKPKVANDESTARLSGDAVTDSEGRVFVETILPGDYGTSPNNRHIHTTIFGAKPEGYDIHFKQYTTFMGKNFSDGSDQHFLADLKKDSDGALVVFLTLEPKFQTR